MRRERSVWVRVVRTAAAGLVVMALAGVALAQPGFGSRKPRKPVDAPAGEAGGNRPDPGMPKGEEKVEEWSQDDPERKQPDVDAKPGEYYCWKTADGLRYAWSLPAPYEKTRAYDLVVMLHPDRMDFRWGPSNHMRGEDGFRPDCLVVSVDGMAANARRPDLRSFECTAENCVRFRDVLLEFSRQLPVKHIYLYGQGGGGRFAAYFSAAFPALADGVLAHGCGITDGGAVKSTVPMVFMHGAKDSITPMSVSLAAKKAYEEAGHKGVRVRVLRGYNDFPNQLCAGDCIEYLVAMRSADAGEVIGAARKMLQPKGPDEFGYRGVPWFAGAYEALQRVADKKGFDTEPTPEQAKESSDWMARIDAEAKGHVENVRRLLAQSEMEKGDFVLDGGPWLGYMLAVRDDFRGVACVEELAKGLKLDEQVARHTEAASDLLVTWATSASDADKFERAVTSLPSCFLYEGLPVDLLPRCRACMRKADELELGPELRNLYEFVQLWEQGWKDGLEAYEQRWQAWEPGEK